jgi:sugar/nucleoside kinase (ribokinase family)
MGKVLAIGNALVDKLIKLKDDSMLKKFGLAKGSMQLADIELVEKIDQESEGNEKFQASGGSAANTIHGLAQLNIETGFIGKVGDDDIGDFFQRDMEVKNISTMLSVSKTPSGKAMTLVTPDSERTFATFLGAAVELSAGDLNDDLFKDYDYFYVEGYLVQNHELLENAVKMAKKNNAVIALDLASYNVVETNLDFLTEIVKQYVDIVFANEEEAMAFTGKEPEEAIKILAEYTDIAIVKTGKNGSLIRKDGETIRVGSIKANAVDSTGAGDLYAAGFLYGLINGSSLEKCGETGALLGGKVIEVFGSKMTEQTWEQLKKQIDNL